MEDAPPGARLLVSVGDFHAGGTVAALNSILTHDDGPTVHPGEINLFLADLMEQCAEDAARWARELGSAGADIQSSVPVVFLHNGDLTEGLHHDTHQVLLPGVKGPQIEIALDLLENIWFEHLDPMAILFTRGTESHVGKAAELEEAVAKILAERGYPVKKTPDTNTWTGYYWEVTLGGHVIWAAHHGRTGRTPRTKASLLALRGSDIFVQTAKDNFERERRGLDPEPIPRLVIGSHHHQRADGGTEFPTRWIQLGCWTFRNSYAHKVASFSREDLGGAFVYCSPERDAPEVRWWNHTPRRSTVCVI